MSQYLLMKVIKRFKTMKSHAGSRGLRMRSGKRRRWAARNRSLLVGKGRARRSPRPSVFLVSQNHCTLWQEPEN